VDSEPGPSNIIFSILLGVLKENWLQELSFVSVSLIFVVILICLSAMFSASENAFFSLGPTEMVELNNDHSIGAKTAIRLLSEPDRLNASRNLLALILLLNNFVNIAIVIISGGVLSAIFDLENYLVLAFILQVVVITFMLVLLGEVIPKIYSTQNNLKIARFTSVPLFWMQKIFYPLTWLITKSTSVFDRFLDQNSYRVSVEELNHAIEIAGVENTPDEKNILRGLVNYGNISVRQIMRNRMDVSAVDVSVSFDELLRKVEDWGYSRLPVYDETFDDIKGILYIKDLVPFIHEGGNHEWQSLMRPPFFVPEFKKIDDLLNDFQDKRTHLAIVVDEYGGTQGIVTMEDVLEEIFGEIKDEFDDEEQNYSQIDEHTFLFEGKISLNDVCKVFSLDNQYFAEVKSESDTLGGLIMEIAQRIPPRGYRGAFKQLTFEVEAADKRRIIRVKTSLVQENNNDESID
jgi:gliding motility-associated protein GldE